MTSADLQLTPVRAPAPFRSFHKRDRDFFAVMVGLIWLGILMGFVPDIFSHIRSGTSFPPIVHIHAAAFVGWLVLLTAQAWLIRTRRPDIHRKLGIAGMVLAAAMVVLGPATAIIVEQANWGSPASRPIFLAVQITDILAFAGLAGAAFVLRRDPPAHKRLILLATLYISDAGFSRWLGPTFARELGAGYLGMFVALYFANDILILAMGGYDLVTRKRLQSVYVAGVVWVFANQVIADLLYHAPAWKPVARAIIGH
jgi:hypothetical protein